MKYPLSVMAFFIMMCTVNSGCRHKQAATNLEGNPFVEEWNTPYGVPPFDKIKTEHYKPAFMEGMRQQEAEIKAITANMETPTFDNTIVPLEYSGALLYRVSAVFMNLLECCANDEMEAIAEEMVPKLSQHNDDIMLNKPLFERVKTVYENRDSENLDAEQLRLLEQTYRNFVRGGANVPENQQKRFRQINEQLAALTLKFGNNVLAATNDYKLVVNDVNQLQGLTEHQLQMALDAGSSSPDTKDKYVFTLDMPTWESFLMNCQNRDLRKQMWTAYTTRCTKGLNDNSSIINTIVNLRLERANILGYKTYADYVLDDCMAKTPAEVFDLLNRVWKPALKKAKEEAALYQQMIDREKGDFKLQPYDWRYYSEKLRKEKYDLNDEDIRPYFSLDTAQKGLFMVCNRLYGITLRENTSIPVYHPDAKAYEVVEQDSVIAIVYMDFFPRAGKKSGAWMTNFREQYYTKDGKKVIPVISLVYNFTRPVGDMPAMLNVDQTQTLFHECGHALHSVFSNCRYRSLSGTNVPRDYVEMPSQFMEHFAFEPEVLKLYARHYQTGEVIPDTLIRKIQTAATYGQGFINTELLAASLLDMDYHVLTKKTAIKLPDFENKSLEAIGLIPSIISRYKSNYFLHIFSNNYAAGYYSYTWAAVLDNDAYEAFKENGIFDKATATAFRNNILARGNTEDPMQLYMKFRGRKPSIDPLLKNRGLE